MSACGKPGEDRHRDDPVVPLHLGGEVVEAPHRAPRRPLAPERRQERRLPERRGRPDAPGDDVEEPLGRLDAPLGHVHVRIGLVAVEEIGAADHRLREVRVEVERHRDGDARPDRLPDGGDEVALAVVQPLRHHRPVEVEEHAREGAAPAEVREHPLLHVVEDVPRHPAGRRGRRGDRRHQGEAAAPPRPRSCRRGTCRCPGSARRSPRRSGGPAPRTAADRSGWSRRCSSRETSSPGTPARRPLSATASCGDRASRGGRSP